MSMTNAYKSSKIKTLYLLVVGIPVILAAIFFSFGVSAFCLSISVVVVVLIAKGILDDIYPQALILIGGLVLLLTAAFLFPDIPLVKEASGSKFIDVFLSVKSIFSSNMSGIGLIIMIIAGFSKYMEEIGASQKLVEISVKPLGVLKSKYIVLGCCFILIQMLAIFITSPAGLSLLLMSTLYPILRSIGCSKGAVAAVIASICINYGPAEVGTILISQLAHHDPFSLFLNVQLPMVVIVFPFIGILHIIMQRYWDKKEVSNGEVSESYAHETEGKEGKPLFYALFPVLPLILLFSFSNLVQDFVPAEHRVSIDIVSALLISFFLAFGCEFIRNRNLKNSANQIKFLFSQMGTSLSVIVSIMLCAQVLAEGLIKIGFVNILFSALPAGQHTEFIIVAFFSLFIFISVMILGSSSTFNAFAPFAADMATQGGVSATKVLLSMYYSAGFGRAFSPIAGFIIAVSALVGLKPYDLIKRNSVQLACGYVLTLGLNYFIAS
jgi:C4-dicarboxylate transporter, DcuC family